MERSKALRFPLADRHLDMLEWFGLWTPEMHRARWQIRRRWPPGFREVADLSATYESHPKWQQAIREFAAPPESCAKGGWNIVDHLLKYRLVEGTSRCARLTPRGRAALRHRDRACPEAFVSHAPDVFDDVSLLPVVIEGLSEIGPDYEVPGKALPDTPETWRRLMIEYHEGDYQGRHTLTRASAHLGRVSSTGTALNGSLRMHSSFLSLSIHNEAGQEVCEIMLAPEQLADLLTGLGNVPVTVSHYFGIDGMSRSEPAPPPVSAMRRMHARLESATDRTSKQITEIIEKVKAMNMGVRAKEDLLNDLGTVLNCCDSGHEFAVQCAMEEASAVVESLCSIAADRVGALGGNMLVGGAKEQVKALAGGDIGIIPPETNEQG